MRRRVWLVVFMAMAFMGQSACSNPTAQKIFSTEVATPATLVTASAVVGCQLVGDGDWLR